MRRNPRAEQRQARAVAASLKALRRKQNQALWAWRMLLYERAMFLHIHTSDLDGQPVEIAVVDADGNEVFYSLVNPGEPIAEGAQGVHGITDANVANAPLLDEILPKLADAIDGHWCITYALVSDATWLAHPRLHELMPPQASLYDWLVDLRDGTLLEMPCRTAQERAALYWSAIQRMALNGGKRVAKEAAKKWPRPITRAELVATLEPAE